MDNVLKKLFIPILMVLLLSPLSWGEAGTPATVAEIKGTGIPGPYSIEPFIGGTLSIVSAMTDDPDSTTIEILTSDPHKGTVSFTRPLLESESVILSFSPLPAWIQRSYTLPQSRSFAPIPVQQVASSVPLPFSGLSFGGSKSFDITAGSSHQPALNQTLRLNIHGNLTPDITLNAAISDQSVPLTPDGDTREISELDRVLIQLRGPNFRLDMGDTDLARQDGRWMSYNRRLSGAYGSMRVGNTKIHSSGAITGGKYTSSIITPIEGNRGPYRLHPSSRRMDIAVVPGTEKVWLNGERLTRGAGEDYIIDYSTGEITFSERRIIGSDMRIVCDYEYSSESFSRNFYTFGGEGDYLDGRLKFRAGVVREADNVSRPILGELDQEMKQALEDAGDSRAFISGIKQSPDSTGTYDMVDDVLVHNPGRKGLWDAVFSWVGADEGSYRYKGGGIYEYVPPELRSPGSGSSYEPFASVASPASHSLSGFSAEITPFPFLRIESELAVSNFDRNTLSQLDNHDNTGSAANFGFSLTPEIVIFSPLRLLLSGNTLTRGSRFNPLDRDRSPEDSRSWGLPLDFVPQEETIEEIKTGINVSDGKMKGTGFLLNWGRADYGQEGLSRRFHSSTEINRQQFGRGYLNFQKIERADHPLLPDSDIERLDGGVEGVVYGFSPSVRWEEERTELTGSQLGSSYEELRTRIATPQFGLFRAEAEWFRRDEYKKIIAWQDSSTAHGGTLGITARGSNGFFRALLSRRERTDNYNTILTEQAVIEGSSRRGRDFSLDLSYRAGRSREALRRKVWLYIGPGRGGWRWEDLNGDGIRDPEEFIPDIHGDYYLFEETLDSYTPVNTVQTYGRLNWAIPQNLTSFFTGDNQVSTETTFEVLEKSSAPTSDVFLLKLWRFLDEDKTASGNIRFQEVVTIPFDNGANLRLRLFRNSSLDAFVVQGAEKRDESEQSGRLRLPVTEETDAEFTLTKARFTRTMETRPAGNYNVGSIQGDTGISWYPVHYVKTSFNIGAGRDSDDISSLTASNWSLKPSVSWFFTGRGRAEFSYAFTNVRASSQTVLPHVMARGRYPGENHDLNLAVDWRLTGNMDLGVTYTGRKFAGRNYENYLRAQMRAVF